MVFISPWGESLVIIALQSVKKLLGINPMVCNAPGSRSLDIITLDQVKNYC